MKFGGILALALVLSATLAGCVDPVPPSNTGRAGVPPPPADYFPAFRDAVVPKVQSIDASMLEAASVVSKYQNRQISRNDASAQLRSIHDSVVVDSVIPANYPENKMDSRIRVVDQDALDYSNSMISSLQDTLFCVSNGYEDYCESGEDRAARGQDSLKAFLLGMRRYAIQECEKINWTSAYEEEEKAQLGEENVRPTGRKCLTASPTPTTSTNATASNTTTPTS